MLAEEGRAQAVSDGATDQTEAALWGCAVLVAIRCTLLGVCMVCHQVVYHQVVGRCGLGNEVLMRF